MSDLSNPEISSSARPDPSAQSFDLDAALTSIVGVRTNIPEESLTAAILGTERAGHGILINEEGLIVTIGYLITEAQTVWLTDCRGHTVPGHVVGYDQETGLGLVQALQRVDLSPLTMGHCADLDPTHAVIVASHGGIGHAMNAQVVAKREFAGYWEYVLDEAIFTAPAHPSWGGAGLIGMDGKLYGVGSLLVQESDEAGHAADSNMFVPIDLLRTVMEDLQLYGRPNRTARPWLGIFVYDVGDYLVVAGVFKDCPAHRADLRPGDVVVDVNGQPVSSLAHLFRTIWALGPAGVEVPLTLVRDSVKIDVTVRSEDRDQLLRTEQLH